MSFKNCIGKGRGYCSIAGIDWSQFVNSNQIAAAKEPTISRRFLP